jgi:hypothetical protein
MDNAEKIRVSYCTTCHGRLWQLALTLPSNLRRLREDEELILVDYGSTDGLGRFVESSEYCREAIEKGRLVYAHTEAASYHCPKAKNLAHRIARGELLVNLDADNNNRGMRRAIERCFGNCKEEAVLQMDEGKRSDPLRGTFGRICLSRYWFYRLGGYDESFLPIGHQDADLVWRAKAMGLRHVSLGTGGPPPIRNTMVEKAAHTGKSSWHAMWGANEKTSRRNLKAGRLVANIQGWGAADVRINFNETQTLPPVSTQFVSLVLVSQQPPSALEGLLAEYNQMPTVGEIILVNQNEEVAIESAKLRVINARGECKPFARLAAAALASFPSVMLTRDDVLLPEGTLIYLHKSWFNQPAMLHRVASGSADEGEPPIREEMRPGKISFSPGTLTTVSTCMAALAYGSQLAAEIGNVADERGEELLLSFVAAKASRPLGRTYELPFSDMPLSGIANFRPPRKSRGVFSPVVRWCRKNVVDSNPPDLDIEVGPSPPAVIRYEPRSTVMPKDGVLFAGPWVGEFGWELCWWNPMIRSLAENYEHVMIAAPESSRYLYEFASEFIPLQTEGWCFAEGKLLSKVPRVCNGSRILNPSELWREFGEQECQALKSGDPTATPKKWRMLAPKEPGLFVADVLCAFRPMKIIYGSVVEGKEYREEKCEELVNLLLGAGLTVACYGGADNYWFEGTIDLRGTELELQCLALSVAKCAVGPSSAPLHLASLCNCAHVTWSRISPEISIRYETLWNPFSARACFLRTPDPSPGEIAEEVLRLMDVRESEEAFG